MSCHHVQRSQEGLLFPAPTGGTITDLRGSLATALERAEIEKAVTLHTLRPALPSGFFMVAGGVRRWGARLKPLSAR